MHLEGNFIESEQGKLFITQIGKVTGDSAILCLPPIMDEMNFSRAVIAKQCQFLSIHEFPCFILDYYGCGDSEGEFEQANCNIWLDNIVTASQWLAEKGIKNLIVFAYRFSGLLAGSSQAYLLKHTQLKGLVLFKPLVTGQTFIKHLNRIHKAGELFSKQQSSLVNTSKIKEIAGYIFSDELITGIESLNLRQAELIVPTHCLELASSRISLPIQQLVNDNDTFASAQYLDCEAFWQVPEIFEVSTLNDPTLSLVKKLYTS